MNDALQKTIRIFLNVMWVLRRLSTGYIGKQLRTLQSDWLLIRETSD